MNITLAKDLSKIATEARRQADYLRILPVEAKQNYEQSRSTSDLLEAIARQIETLVAKHFILCQLVMDEETMKTAVSRQIRAAIRQEKIRETVLR